MGILTMTARSDAHDRLVERPEDMPARIPIEGSAGSILGSPGRGEAGRCDVDLRRRIALILVLLAATSIAAPTASRGEGTMTDPLETDIVRWTTYVKDHPETTETWAQIKLASEPTLTRAADALREGHRFLALSRLMAVYPNLGSATFMDAFSNEELQDTTAFRDAWQRHATILREELRPVMPGRLEGITPAAARAVAEVALLQVREYYIASADFERATDPTSGFFYLGYACAQRDLTAFCRTWAGQSGKAPALRGLQTEIDALEDEVLRAYRPPASIERHSEFILAGSFLKEARELTASGLHHGALLRYLQAALRFDPIREHPGSRSTAELRGRLDELRPRLSVPGEDHTIARIFLELAESELAASPPDSATPFAVAAVTDVLPRYLAALGAAPEAPHRPAPRVTVTLVRWPYT
jgi:hypothetical protein